MTNIPNHEIKPFCPLCSKSHKMKEVENDSPLRDFRCDETGCRVTFPKTLELKKKDEEPLVIDPLHQKFLEHRNIDQTREWVSGV